MLWLHIYLKVRSVVYCLKHMQFTFPPPSKVSSAVYSQQEHIRFDNWVLNTVKQHPNRFYDEWFADGGRVLLYDQLQTVHGQSCPPAGLSSVTNLRPEGYAAYKVGKCYLELSEFTVLKEGAPTSQ